MGVEEIMQDRADFDKRVEASSQMSDSQRARLAENARKYGVQVRPTWVRDNFPVPPIQRGGK